MGEYEDRYPDAYGRNEVIEDRGARHFTGRGLPRQTRDQTVVETPPAAPQPDTPPRTSRSFVARPASDIRDDAMRELAASPFIDAAGIDVAVAADGVVTLSGTINSLIAIPLARALVSNIAGVRRVETQLRLARAARSYDPPTPEPGAG